MHAHLDREGLKRRHVAMSGLRYRRDVLDRIGTLAGSMEQGAWLVTAPLGEPPFYFFDDPGHESDLYPTRWELDEVAPDRPVYIRPILGFWRWSPWPECLVSAANSVALDAVGLTDDTAPPTPTVELERDPAGRLTGRFFERTTASILELTHFSKAFRSENVDRLQALDVSQRVALSTATTTIFEGHGVEPAVHRAYAALHRAGRMAIRAELVFSPDWSNSAVAPNELIDRELGWLAGNGRGDDVLRMRGIFINPLVTDDDRVRSKTGYTGMAGYHFGSGLSETTTLDLLKALARAQLRADTAPVADLMPLRRLLDAGVLVSIASDNIPPSLFFAIWCCLARQDYRGQVLPDPEGPVSRAEALRIATLDAARCLGRDDSLGSLTPGKYADLAVLDRDFFDCPLGDIPKIEALATMVCGRWRYGDPVNLSQTPGAVVVTC